MLTEEQLIKAWEDAPEELLMKGAEFEHINELSSVQLRALPADTLRRFLASRKYHAGQRQKIEDLEGISVGGLTAEEVLKKTRGQTSSN